MIWAAAVLPAASGACASRTDLRRALESFAPAERIRAAKTIAQLGDRRYVPALVDRLDDEDVAVRFAAISALENLTGERLGYDCWAAPDVRSKAVDDWREYVRGLAGPAQTTAQASTGR